MKNERKAGNKDSLQPHPLNGKYIIYNYTEDDGNGGYGWTLALYKLNGDKPEKIHHPREHTTSVLGGYDNENLLKLVKKLKINEVYSVISSKDFFGIPVDLFNDGYDVEDPEADLYGDGPYVQNKPVYKNTKGHALLKEAGIKVKYFDEDQKKFFDQDPSAPKTPDQR